MFLSEPGRCSRRCTQLPLHMSYFTAATTWRYLTCTCTIRVSYQPRQTMGIVNSSKKEASNVFNHVKAQTLPCNGKLHVLLWLMMFDIYFITPVGQELHLWNNLNTFCSFLITLETLSKTYLGIVTQFISQTHSFFLKIIM